MSPDFTDESYTGGASLGASSPLADYNKHWEENAARKMPPHNDKSTIKQAGECDSISNHFNVRDDSYSETEGSVLTGKRAREEKSSETTERSNKRKQESKEKAKKPMTAEALRETAREIEVAMASPDAIMEPRCYEKVWKYATTSARLAEMEKHSNEEKINTKQIQSAAANKAMGMLVMGYTGYAQYSCLVSDWLRSTSSESQPNSYEHSSNESSGFNSSLSNASLSYLQEDQDPAAIVLKIVEETLRNTFNVAKADALLENRSNAARLEKNLVPALCKSPRARESVVRLFNEYGESALLRHLLRQLSKLGFHKEIADLIEVADIFEVYTNTLQYSLAKVPTANHFEISADWMPRLVRLCCSTDYMFGFSQLVLGRLEKRFEADGVEKGIGMFTQCARKVKRLRQELAITVSKSEKAGADVTLLLGANGAGKDGIMKERHGTIRKTAMEVLKISSKKGSHLIPGNLLESLAKSYCLMPLIDELEGKAKGAAKWEGTINGAPDIELLRYPQLTEALLKSSFRASQRNPEPKVKMAACALLGYASTKECRPEITIDCVEALWESCLLCEADTKFGQQSKDRLMKNMEKHPIVSAAALMWCRSQVANPTLTNTALYLTMAPLYIDLCGFVIQEHPLLRTCCLDLLMDMIRVNRKEEKGGIESAIRIKKLAFDLMVEMIRRGFITETIARFIEELDGAATKMDLSLVRYFLSGILTVAMPKETKLVFSLEFVATMKQLLLHHRVKAAVMNLNFEKASAEKLALFISIFLGDMLVEEKSSELKVERLPLLIKRLGLEGSA
mmetsp:Transcript_16716/g.24750  ORF Transcript_16716/g.24750 Transcript_16716/m.24750 type:complete len:795 (+) Transcript_16716:55-2439(+)